MIYEIRGQQMMLDSDLAKLYQCKDGTKEINQAVKRHINRFPERFMFQLIFEEYNNLRFQFGTANISSMSRINPRVFTEQGVAISMSIKIINSFVIMKKYISSNLLEQTTWC